MITLLHLDDDALFLHRCSVAFRSSPHVAHVSYASTRSAEEFRHEFSRCRPTAILLDLSFGGSATRGLDILQEIRSSGYDGTVIMMSALSTSDVIMDCIRSGANDFLSKGLDESEMTFRVARLLQGSRLSRDQDVRQRQLLPTHVSGRSLREVHQRLMRLRNSAVRSLLVTGESGTGKEMVAEILQLQLPQGTPFVSVNCAALAPTVVEAEIFGYEKGAFTGATHSKIGLYEAADGGWLFLDEVARLSASAQASLLRALENGEVRPVGSTRTKKVNVRVIAATNEPLDALADKGEFRGDLLTRLRGYEISLPPLRARTTAERQEIIESLLARLNESLSLDENEYRLSSSCAAVLLDLPWSKGNVRELWQTLQAMSVDATDGVITIEHLPNRYVKKTSQPDEKDPTSPEAYSTEGLPEGFDDILNPKFPCQFERMIDTVFDHVLHRLKMYTSEKSPSQRTVAQLLNVSRHEATQRIARAQRK
ncbi:MAG: sigma-54-dependent Fis family transcriptional regulator [Proteobacteria bacterium]|nr:sigma-54-dependent Fis family transcriptional regulator [Pseudomonadota bacterium]